MILVFEEKEIREKFEREIKDASIYHKEEAEYWGGEEYSRKIMLPFYRNIFRKNVAQRAIEYEHVILDCDPYITSEKCPIIYITNIVGGNNEAFGQLFVKYAGSVEATMEEAKKRMQAWLAEYGEGRREVDFYQDFLEVSITRMPKKIRIVGMERANGTYVAVVITDFHEEMTENIKQSINDIENAGYVVFVDDDVNSGYFNFFDNYYNLLEADSMESFLDVCKTLKERNERVIYEIKLLDDIMKNDLNEWKHHIQENISFNHMKDSANDNYNKIPDGVIEIHGKEVSEEIQLCSLGIEAGAHDVVLLKKVLVYLQEQITKYDSDILVKMYFKNEMSLEELLPKNGC